MSSLSLALSLSASGRWRSRVRRPDGTRTAFSPWRPNLILDGGLNLLAATSWGNMALHATYGTGNLAVEKQTNGTGVTLSQATNQVTATGSFFASTDVGAILKYGTTGTAGVEQYITGYTSAFVVTVSSSATVAPTDGTVWQVQQTALQTFLAGDNGTYEADAVTVNAAGTPYLRFKRGFQFPAVGGSVTIKEIGFGPNNTNTQPWSRVLVPGAGDALTVGQVYEVEYQLTVNLPDGAAQVAVADVSGGAWNTAGNFIMEYFGVDQAIESNPPNLATYDPGFNSARPDWDAAALITTTWSQRSLISNTPNTVVTAAPTSTVQAAYSAGTFQVTRTSVYNIGAGNGTVYGLGFGRNIGFACNTATIKFTTPVTKDNSHTLTLVYNLTFGRVLSN